MRKPKALDDIEKLIEEPSPEPIVLTDREGFSIMRYFNYLKALKAEQSLKEFHDDWKKGKFRQKKKSKKSKRKKRN